MVYFPDLADRSRGSSPVPLLSIGWLEAGMEFPTSAPSEALLESLWRFCMVYVSPSRGVHRCPFCASPFAHVTERNGMQVALGSAEIRVFGNAGRPVFAAPNLVFHYVSVHHYLPPLEFIDALATGPQPGTPEYERLLDGAQMRWMNAPVLGDEPAIFNAVKVGDEVVWQKITKNG